MKFRSTRGDPQLISFEEMLVTAYGRDGGLLMPEHIPEISITTLRNWKTLSYNEIVKKILSLFISEEEISLHEQSNLVDKAFRKFDINEVVRLSSISDRTQVMELWHGESMTFKDIAMSCLTEFLGYFLEKRQTFFTALVVTSGDTGASAALSICGSPNIDVIVLYPDACVSDIQAQMMTSIPHENVHVYAVKGDMYECDSLMLDIFEDKQFVTKNSLGTMNSMNCCRILVQMAHHVYAYLQAADSVGDTVDIVIPTGGAGNIASCYLAQQCGVPIKAHAITNSNECFHHFVTGNKAKLFDVVNTMAPSMDVSFPFNFERVIWLASNQSGEIVSNATKTFHQGEELNLPAAVHQNVTKYMKSSTVDEESIITAMKRCYLECGYPVCPHTAVALSYVFSKKLEEDCNKIVVMATASPAKFPEMMKRAGLKEIFSEKVNKIKSQKQRLIKLEKGSNWVDCIQNKITSITSKHSNQKF